MARRLGALADSAPARLRLSLPALPPRRRGRSRDHGWGPRGSRLWPAAPGRRRLPHHAVRLLCRPLRPLRAGAACRLRPALAALILTPPSPPPRCSAQVWRAQPAAAGPGAAILLPKLSKGLRGGAGGLPVYAHGHSVWLGGGLARIGLAWPGPASAPLVACRAQRWMCGGAGSATERPRSPRGAHVPTRSRACAPAAGHAQQQSVPEAQRAAGPVGPQHSSEHHAQVMAAAAAALGWGGAGGGPLTLKGWAAAAPTHEPCLHAPHRVPLALPACPAPSSPQQDRHQLEGLWRVRGSGGADPHAVPGQHPCGCPQQAQRAGVPVALPPHAAAVAPVSASPWRRAGRARAPPARPRLPTSLTPSAGPGCGVHERQAAAQAGRNSLPADAPHFGWAAAAGQLSRPAWLPSARLPATRDALLPRPALGKPLNPTPPPSSSPPPQTTSPF